MAFKTDEDGNVEHEIPAMGEFYWWIEMPQGIICKGGRTDPDDSYYKFTWSTREEAEAAVKKLLEG